MSRQLEWADDPNADDYATLNPNGAINIMPDTEQVFMFSMGIWPTSDNVDQRYIYGDHFDNTYSTLLIMDNAKTTLAALTVTSAAVLATLY